MAVKREQVVQTAEKFVARGKIEPAIREYRKLLEDNPNDINTLNRVGDLYARIQRIDEAVDFFNQIAEQYAGEGFFVKAIAIYKKIIKLDPTRLDVYENLAELYHRQGLVTEARTQYQVLADYYQKHENATSTIAIYQKMAQLEPNNPTYHVKLAELYHQQKLVEKAMGEYRIIAELMIAHGHPQEAAQVYERSLAIDSTNIAFITDAALKLKEAAGTAMAARFLSAAVERNPAAAQVARLIGSSPAASAAGAAAFSPGLGGTHAGIAPAAPLPVPSAQQPEAAPPAGAGGRAPAGPAGMPAAAGAPVRPPPAPPQEPPPAPAAAADAGAAFDLDQEMEFEIDLGADLLLEGDGLEALPDAVAGPSRPAGAPPASRAFEPEFEIEEDAATAPGVEPGASAPGKAPAGGAAEGEVDLEDVFILDIEDDEEPASLVKPPPDMLQEPRRPAWAQDAAVPPAPAAGAPSIEPPRPEASRPPDLGAAAAAAVAEPPPPPAAGAAPTAAAEAPAATVEAPSAAVEAPAAARATPAAVPPPEEPLAVPATQAVAEPPAIKIDSELLERTAAELLPPPVERYEDLVSEAEVLAKYGLEKKAIERLREAVRLKPRQFAAYLLLIQLYFEEGRHARVIELANQVRQLSEAGDREPWAKLRKRLLAAGYRLDGDRVAAGPEAPGARAAEPPREASRPAAAPSVTAGAGEAGTGAGLLDAAAAAAKPPALQAPPLPPSPETAPAEGSHGGAAGAVRQPVEAAGPPVTPAAATSAPARRPRKVTDTGIDQMLRGLIEPTRTRRKPAAAPAAPPAAISAPSPAAPPVEMSPAGALPSEAPPVPLPPSEAPAAAASSAAVEPEAEAAPPEMAAAPAAALPAAAAEADLIELPPLLAPGEAAPPAEVAPGEIFDPLEIGAMVEREEIDWDDAGRPAGGFGAVEEPGAAPGIAAAAAPSAAAPAGSPPPSAAAPSGPAYLDDSGMSWLDEADSGKRKSVAKGSSLFDDEADFFDLAGELEQELSQEPVFQADEMLVQQEQSLEEIVEGFKRGVAEHLSPTDYDTHFNLGIAYREMGLLDEAIGEFQLSAKDARYLVSCCSMLGLCFLDKGLPELAVKWYRRGLEAEGVGEDDTLGLLYDMGCAYLTMGDNAAAYKTFVDAYGINTHYRDVVARIEELGRPH